MPRNSLFDELPPAEAIQYKGLRYVLRDNGKLPGVTIWYGKSKRPKRWSFRTAESRQLWLDSEKANQDGREKLAIRRQAERDQRLAEMLDKIQVGALLCNSWGYEQTNVDFYQVVERKGRVVILREIGGRVVEGSEGFMSNRVVADRDAFLKDKAPIRKMITAYGIKMEHGYTGITGDDEVHYQSWYA